MRAILAFCLGIIAITSSAARTSLADAPAYSSAGGISIAPPTDPLSFTTVLAAFPATNTQIIDGYPLASRLLSGAGRTVSLQATFGSSEWLSVATLANTDPAMDPAFLELTPSGEKIALGVGLNKPLYVFPTSILSVSAPPVLTTSSAAQRYANLSYYSAAFRDERYLFINAGGAVLGESYVYVLDTEAAAETTLPIIGAIPGASSGIAFDAAGDLVTGIGWDADDTRTGEIKIFDAASIDAALAGTPLDYGTTGAVLATGLLSADSLGFDSSGDLDVGGGDVFGTSGHYGYANVVSANVVARVLAGGPAADSSDPNDVATIEPDPCHNDDSTTIVFVPGVDILLVSADMETAPPNCATVDYTQAAAPTTVYIPPGAPSENGIPDGVNPNFEPREFYGAAQLSRLVNALDSTTGDSNFDATVDYVADGTINDTDFNFLTAHWGLPITN